MSRGRGSFGYQTDSQESPPQRSPSGESLHFHEPERDIDEEAEGTPNTHSARTWAEWKVPRSLLRICFRIRNTSVDETTFVLHTMRRMRAHSLRPVCVSICRAMVYSFLLLLFNVWLNIEVYRETIRSAIDRAKEHAEDRSLPTLPEALSQRSLLQNLYIASLLGPLSDLLSRIVARNFFKLCLAKSMSHCRLAASLAQCTPSLNAYTLLILRGSGHWIPLILLLDLGEYIYSIRLWQYQQQRQVATSLIMYIKLVVVGWTAALCLFDICYLYTRRRFLLRPLPPHLHPVYICWDANHQFHWSSPNNMLDLLEEHEEIHGAKFQTQESREIRRRIARWNQGEEALEHFGEEQETTKEEQQQQQQRGSDKNEDAQAEDEEKQEAVRLIAANGNGNGWQTVHGARR